MGHSGREVWQQSLTRPERLFWGAEGKELGTSTCLVLRRRACAQIRYPASQPTLSPHLSGRHFVALFGAATPCIESLLVKRKVKGPCWLVLSAPQLVEYCNQVRACAAGQ